MWYKNILDENENIIGRETTTDYSAADYYVTEESSIPKVYGGFGTTLKVYGVDFGINFTYQLGGKQYDGTYAQFMSSPTGTTGYNFHKDLLNSWTPENTGSDIPRFQLHDQYSAASSTRFLTNASYLNIQNINVGYTLPASWTKNWLSTPCVCICLQKMFSIGLSVKVLTRVSRMTQPLTLPIIRRCVRFLVV